MNSDRVTSPVVLEVDGLDQVIRVMRADGWQVVGPTVLDGAVVPGPVRTVADLPRGVGDTQRPGEYRLRERGDQALFGYANAATSFKPVLLPPEQVLWRGTRRSDGFDMHTPADEPQQRVLLGVRGCDLAGIEAQDRVLRERWGNRPAVDPRYAAAREASFVIAVACGSPADTCFCSSTGTGPAPDGGYDLSLTEVLDEGGHRFVVTVGSDRGGALLDRVPHRPADPADVSAAQQVVDAAQQRMGRSLDASGLAALLDAEVEHPIWDEIAQRCLACGNCTAVCPTCFCTAVDDITDLTGDTTERVRRWDSCFTAGFSYVHGGPVRSSTASRYRQWMSHKLGTWQAQFDTAGCVGCGRCIAWCPVGIDITAEARALAQRARSAAASEGAE